MTDAEWQANGEPHESAASENSYHDLPTRFPMARTASAILDRLNRSEVSVM